jgi:hypothetical protein
MGQTASTNSCAKLLLQSRRRLYIPLEDLCWTLSDGDYFVCAGIPGIRINAHSLKIEEFNEQRRLLPYHFAGTQ